MQRLGFLFARRGYYLGLAWCWQGQLDAIMRLGNPKPGFVAKWAEKIADAKARAVRER